MGGLQHEEITKEIIGASYAVANDLGYNLTEFDYSVAMAIEFKERGLQFIKEYPAEILYKGKPLRKKKLDFLVEDEVVLELKVSEFIPKTYIHQVISYLKATNLETGLIVCFSKSQVLIKRVINTPEADTTIYP